MINIAAAKLAVTKAAGAAQLLAKANSPHLLFAAGVVGVAATVVLASKSTLKVSDVLDEHEQNKAAAKELHERSPEKYDEKMLRKDMLVLQTNLALDMVKLYAPAAIVGVASIAAFGGSHYILTTRNAALTATVAGLEKAFREYRERVIADQGEDKDRQYLYGSVEHEVYVGETKKGEPIIETQTRYGKPISMYAKVFDDTNLNWQSTLQYRLYFLRLVQNQMNDRLQARGHVMLNEVYRELGMKDTEPGSVVGWKLGAEGDDFIDFGIWSDRNLEQVHPHMVNDNGSLLLDFNVNGPIYKMLGRSKF